MNVSFEGPLTKSGRKCCTLTIKPASPWGLQPKIHFSLKEDSFQRSCREINVVCPERYRDTFIDNLFKNHIFVERLPSALLRKRSTLLSPGQAFLDSAWLSRDWPSRSWSAKGCCCFSNTPSPSRVSSQLPSTLDEPGSVR